MPDDVILQVVEETVTVELTELAITVAAAEQVVHIVTTGATGPTGPRGADGARDVDAVAGEPLGGQRVVILSGSTDGVPIAFHASGFTGAELGDALAAVGVTVGAAIEGDPVLVRIIGPMSDTSFTTLPDGALFLADNGLLTGTQPAAGDGAVFARVIATKFADDAILIAPQPPIFLT